jgi:hypothetical protein
MSNKWTDMQPTRTRAWLSPFSSRVADMRREADHQDG